MHLWTSHGGLRSAICRTLCHSIRPNIPNIHRIKVCTRSFLLYMRRVYVHTNADIENEECDVHLWTSHGGLRSAICRTLCASIRPNIPNFHRIKVRTRSFSLNICRVHVHTNADIENEECDVHSWTSHGGLRAAICRTLCHSPRPNIPNIHRVKVCTRRFSLNMRRVYVQTNTDIDNEERRAFMD